MVDLKEEGVNRLRKTAVFTPAFRSSANAPFDIHWDGHGPLLAMFGVFQGLASLGMQDSQQIGDVEIIIELFLSSVVKPAFTSLCRKSPDPRTMLRVEADRQQFVGGRGRKTSGLNRYELVKNCGPDRNWDRDLSPRCQGSLHSKSLRLLRPFLTSNVAQHRLSGQRDGLVTIAQAVAALPGAVSAPDSNSARLARRISTPSRGGPHGDRRRRAVYRFQARWR
jgi:hypothetical protein